MVAFGECPWVRSSPPDIGASEKTPQLAGLRFFFFFFWGVWSLHCAPCAAGVKVTCAPSQSRQCGEESQALIRLFSCAPRLVWENICPVSRTREGRNASEIDRAITITEAQAQPVVGEGESSVKTEGRWTARRKGGWWGRKSESGGVFFFFFLFFLWRWGAKEDQKPFCVRAVLLVDVYAWVLHRMGAKIAPDPPGTSSRSASLLTETHRGGRAPRAPAKPSAPWPTAEW